MSNLRFDVEEAYLTAGCRHRQVAATGLVQRSVVNGLTTVVELIKRAHHFRRGAIRRRHFLAQCQTEDALPQQQRLPMIATDLPASVGIQGPSQRIDQADAAVCLLQ